MPFQSSPFPLETAFFWLERTENVISRRMQFPSVDRPAPPSCLISTAQMGKVCEYSICCQRKFEKYSQIRSPGAVFIVTKSAVVSSSGSGMTRISVTRMQSRVYRDLLGIIDITICNNPSTVTSNNLLIDDQCGLPGSSCIPTGK